MNKIGLLICGNSGIDYESVSYPYEVVHSLLIIDGKEYEDFVDIKADEFYRRIALNPDVSLSTAQASTGEMLEKLTKLKNDGYKDIIVITIAAPLSGTYQNAVLASQMIEDVNVYVHDSTSVSYGQMAQVYRAIDLIKEGKTPEEIINDLKDLQSRIQLYVLVDTLKFLVKNGRLSATSGAIGSLLKIKPLLHFTETGQLIPLEKIRTASKARKRLLEIAKEEIKNGVEMAFIAYTNNKDFADELRVELLKEFPGLTINLYPLTPVVGAHAGPGTAGIGVIRKKQ